MRPESDSQVPKGLISQPLLVKRPRGNGVKGHAGPKDFTIPQEHEFLYQPHQPTEPTKDDVPIPTPLDSSKFACAAVELTAPALAQNTFAVGGVLLDSTGKVWQAMHNHVIENNCINDPTAHGERQLLSWYLQQRTQGVPIPDPDQMTIVTSLDPCVMCTGAFLATGVNVAIISLDDMAGVNYKADDKLLVIPEAMRPEALAQFSYLGLQGNPVRAFAGSPRSVFVNQSIPQSDDAASLANFTQSAKIVYRILDELDPAPVNVLSPGGASGLKIVKHFYPQAAVLNVDLTSGPSCLALRAAMTLVAQLRHSPSGRRNAAALIDPFGNVLMIAGYEAPALGGTELDTPFMVLTRNYATCRKLTLGVDGALPHPKRCNWVLLKGAGDTLETDLMDLGAYGSTMEGALPEDVETNFFYFDPQQTAESLAKMTKALPPLYSDVIKVNPIQLRTVMSHI
ncbi:hypothetical protein CMUS01_04527 [Colletotrichum musicola]|uniref:CMP/dCMP-type deaminase domain-containing protein n=1 Tax=Colletotrichum musicola TaxID=2175873 RepID=A0A8H6KXE2_9PEZI|nr:hypothetical protein CMUS01_04527 [Colletotrichum musicola]